MSMVNYVAAALQRRPEPGLRHRRLLRRHDDQRPARRLPGRVQGRRGVHGRAVRLLRHHRRLDVEQRSAPAGSVIKTPQQWGDLVRSAYPGYTGARPRMQLWHGTADTTLRYPNFGEEIKQWTNVLGAEPDARRPPTRPQSGWTRTRYGGTGDHGAGRGDQHRQGVGHSLPLAGMAAMAIAFFGLNDPDPADDARRPTPPADTRRRPPAADEPADHAAAVGRLPGHLHGQRLEHRPDREHHHHQHRHDRRSTAGRWSSPCPAGRPSPPAGTPPTRRPAVR